MRLSPGSNLKNPQHVLSRTGLRLMLLCLLLIAPAALATKLDSQLNQATQQLLRGMKISLIKDLDLKEPKTIAVLPFQPIGKTSRELGVFLTDEVSARLFGQGFWKLVERAQLGKLIQEQGFSQSAYADPQALELGKLAGAQAIVTGSYTELGADIRVNLRLISVQTGTVLASASTRIPSKDFGKLLKP